LPPASVTLLGMSLATEMDADIDSLKTEIGILVTSSAASVTCVFNRIERRLDMGDAGYLDNRDAEIVTVLGDWATAPTVNDRVTISSIGYRVLTRQDSVNGILSTLGLTKSN